MASPLFGSSKDELDSPALCLDLDVMESNIRALVATCRRHGVNWRPHAKCHKSTEIARQIIEAGAIGVTCAKLGEAEVMAQAGVQDMLIANQLVGPRKIERLAALRRRANPIVCVDHEDQLAPLNAAGEPEGHAIRLLVEVDIGMCRAGTAPGRPAVELARRISRCPGLEMSGVMGYEGHLLTVADPSEKGRLIQAALNLLVETKELVEQEGIACPIVSCGGTGSYIYAVRHPGITELQAGGAIFMDAFYREACQVADLGFALTVLTTVVSRPTAERAIIDAGRKTLNQEIHPPRVAGRPGIEVAQLSAEHGTLKLSPEAQDLRIGERLELIPGYGDLTTVLHDEFYAFRGERLETIVPIEARGKLR
jgi:D-serine deaminase-like pyridoxal phosphate-dependent protein